jgi:hypothetical protein
MSVLLSLLLSASPASAGWWSTFCARYLVADDPAPYAEYDYIELLDLYFRTHDSKMLDEIVYRLRAGRLTQSETRAFWERFRSKNQP